MSVKFLSEDYMTEGTTALNGDAGFTGAIANVDLNLQFVVTDGPDGELPYYLHVADGAAELVLGAKEDADVTVSTNMETMAGISKGEINTQMAFMTGKLNVTGNMAKLMMNQGVINAFASAMSGMDVDY